MNLIEKMEKMRKLRMRILKGEVGLFDGYAEALKIVFDCKSEPKVPIPPREDDKKP